MLDVKDVVADEECAACGVYGVAGTEVYESLDCWGLAVGVLGWMRCLQSIPAENTLGNADERTTARMSSGCVESASNVRPYSFQNLHNHIA